MDTTFGGGGHAGREMSSVRSFGSASRLGREVWARSLEARKDRLVAKTAGHSISFTVSDDGARVFYSTADETVTDGTPVLAAIRTITVNSREDKILISYNDSRGSGNVTPIAHRGRYLLYQDPEKAQRIMDIETSETWPLATEPLTGVTADLLDGTWAPDGSNVVCTGRRNVPSDGTEGADLRAGRQINAARKCPLVTCTGPDRCRDLPVHYIRESLSHGVVLHRRRSAASRVR